MRTPMAGLAVHDARYAAIEQGLCEIMHDEFLMRRPCFASKLCVEC